LSEFKDYYNQHRAHAALQGKTPIENSDFNIAASFKSYAWRANTAGICFRRHERRDYQFAMDRLATAGATHIP